MIKLQRLVLKSGLAAMALVMAGGANAAVTYSFVSGGTSLGSNAPVYGGRFVFTTPRFITTNRFVPAAILDSCTVTQFPTFSCGRQEFYPDFIGGDVVVWQIIPPGGGQPRQDGFYFATGAFSAIGTYDALRNAPGSLIVSGVEDIPLPGLPDPATWATMLLGFGIVGSVLRRGRVMRPHLV